MNSMRIDEFLQEMMVSEGTDMVKYRKLSENDKNALSKDMVEAMFYQITNKYNSIDFDIIEDTKGDIEKLRGYNDMMLSIQALKEIRNRGNFQIRDLDTIEMAIKHVKDYTKQWEIGFRLNKGLPIMFYNSIVSAIICSLSYLISTCLDFITDINGSFDVKLKEQNDNNFSAPTIFIKNLNNFNKVALNGELAKFFEVSYSKQGFASISIASTTLVMGTSALMGLGILISIIPIIREMIYQFYYMRVSISEHLRVQANYIELNQGRLMNMKNGKNIKGKQDKVANSLIKIADKIDVDQKTATKKAEMEIKKENNKNNIKNVTVDSSVSSSYGSIL